MATRFTPACGSSAGLEETLCRFFTVLFELIFEGFADRLTAASSLASLVSILSSRVSMHVFSSRTSELIGLADSSRTS